MHWRQTKITIKSRWFARKSKPDTYSDILWESFLGCVFLPGLAEVLVQVLPWQVIVEPPLFSMWPLCLFFFFCCRCFGHIMGTFLKPTKGNKDGSFYLLSPNSTWCSCLGLGEQVLKCQAETLLLVACSGRWNAIRSPLVKGPFS